MANVAVSKNQPNIKKPLAVESFTGTISDMKVAVVPIAPAAR